VFVYASFEAMRTWRFEPAKLKGKPVKVYYSLTVNFKAPRCTDLDRME
ncbi:MAG: energy transducer TonB, partial [Myxococcota bacterium]